MEMSDADLDYENIMTFYAKVLKKDRDAFEQNKTRKINDVEIWTRARKEEERVAMEDYCKDHGQAEIEQIQKAIADRHAKELATKNALTSAAGAYAKYMEKMMVERQVQLREKERLYINEISDEVKGVLMKAAEQVYKKNLIKILNAEAEKKRQQ